MSGLDDRQRVDDYLAGHNTMTLGTCSGAGPWAAAVFYAHDSEFALYFKSDPNTRHMRDIASSPIVAATIHDDGQGWRTLRGLQLVGECSKVTEQNLASADRCYVDKFPFLAKASDRDTDTDERVLVQRFISTPYYQLRPRWIRLIDNVRGFGNKTEISIEIHVSKPSQG